MILHINHIPSKQTGAAGNVASTLVSVAGEGQVSPRLLENLNVHLEWLQYKTNFREAITLRRALKGRDVLPWIELGVDLRQVQLDCLKDEFVAALGSAAYTGVLGLFLAFVLLPLSGPLGMPGGQQQRRFAPRW